MLTLRPAYADSAPDDAILFERPLVRSTYIARRRKRTLDPRGGQAMQTVHVLHFSPPLNVSARWRHANRLCALLAASSANLEVRSSTFGRSRLNRGCSEACFSLHRLTYSSHPTSSGKTRNEALPLHVCRSESVHPRFLPRSIKEELSQGSNNPSK